MFLSGYTNFVAPVAMRKDDGRPHWIAEIDFSELKLKLMASIVAISGIKLLEAFMNIDHESDRELYWLVGIHLTFVVSTLVLALAERFGTAHAPVRRTAVQKASDRYFSRTTFRHSGGSAARGSGGLGGPGRGCSASSVNHQLSDLSQPSPGGTGSCGSQPESPAGHLMRIWKW